MWEEIDAPCQSADIQEEKGMFVRQKAIALNSAGRNSEAFPSAFCFYIIQSDYRLG